MSLSHLKESLPKKSSIMTVDLGQKCPSHKVITESTNSGAMTEKVMYILLEKL